MFLMYALYVCRKYMDAAGEEFGHKYGTLIYLGASASAEFFADIGLCPFESVKVNQHTRILSYYIGLRD